ncbi:MAG: aminoglycoside phosphotransferase family protein [Acidobacteria bacterium]|nr:MAG: aminoglycoside phosphotransferase family protein [Acidobacteriota bacterium]
MGRPVPSLDDAALDPNQMLGAIRALTEQVPQTRLGVRAVTVEPLERRLLRYRVELDVAHPSWSVIGKVYDNRVDGQRAFDAMRRLWDGGFSARPPAGVRIPQPYRYLTDLRLLLMEDVPGKPLKTLVKRKVAGPAEMRMLAVALGKLHASALAPGVFFGVNDHLAVRCAGRHEALAQAFPDVAPQVRWIAERARELERRQGAAPTAVHGDFHLGQVHVLDDRAWILDLDPLHVGDPAYDVAMVFVMFKQLERKMHAAAYLRSLRDAFIDEYFSQGGYEIAGRIPLHVALIHLKRACKRFRYQDEDGWRDTVRRQIEEGVACMEQMDATPVLRSAWDVAALYDECPATV